MNGRMPREPKLLFIVDFNFGSLGEAMYFLKGNRFDASLLLPENLFTLNKDSIPYPLYSYKTVSDIERTIDRVEPRVIFLCSGYLLLAGECFTPGNFFGLLNHILSRGIILVTSNVFLNIWAQLDVNDPAYQHHPFTREFVRTNHWLYHQLITLEKVDLTPVELLDKTNLNALSYYNKNIRSSALELRDFKRKALKHLGIPASPPYWLFFLGGAEYYSQVNSFKKYGPHPAYFHSILWNKLGETLENGRIPVLITLSQCIDSLKQEYPQSKKDIIFLSYCDFDTYNALSLTAEYVFSWNIFSFSLLTRIFNKRPLFFFSKGHVASIHPYFFTHFSRHFPDCKIDFVSPKAKLKREELRSLSKKQHRSLFQPFYEGLKDLDSPGEVIDKIMKKKPGGTFGHKS